MEVVFVYEREGLQDAVTQTKNKIVDMVDSALNLLNPSKTENLILPILPKIKFPNTAKVNSYEGLSSDYNIPDRRVLDEIEWSSFFPVNKSYPFQHNGSNNNGYDYVRFLQRRLNNKLPFRLIAFDKNNPVSATVGIASDVKNNNVGTNTLTNLIEIIFDGIVVVENFDTQIDNMGDIQYSLKLKQFTGMSNMLIDWASLSTTVLGNALIKTTNKALKNAGLI